MAAAVVLANLPQLLIAFNGALGLATQLAAMVREHPEADADLRYQLAAFRASAQSVADQVAAYRPIPAPTDPPVPAPQPLGAAAAESVEPPAAAAPSSAPPAGEPSSSVPDPAAPHVFASAAGSGDCSVCHELPEHPNHAEAASG